MNDSDTYIERHPGGDEVGGSLARKVQYLLQDDILQEENYVRDSGYTHINSEFTFGINDKTKHETITGKQKVGGQFSSIYGKVKGAEERKKRISS